MAQSILLPTNRYRDFKRWIPEEDADGIDLRNDVLAKCINMDFNQAHMSNAVKPSAYDLPTDVQTEIDSNDYTLKDAAFFSHNERGECEFYVLYKFSDPDHLMKFFIKDDGGTTELSLDEENDNVAIESEPTNISFCYAEDQLKINMNVILDYGTISQRVVGNLTLFYITTTKRVASGLGLDIPTRNYGWYLSPRWLGWSYGDSIVTVAIGDNTVITHNSSVGDATNSHGEIQEISDIEHTIAFSYSGGGAARFKSGTESGASYTIGNIDYASKVEFYWNAYSWGTEGSALTNCTFQIFDQDADVVIFEEELPTTNLTQWVKKSFKIPKLAANMQIIIIKPEHTGVTPVKFPHIDEITIFYEWEDYEWAIIGVNDDRQRFLIQYDTGIINIDAQIRIARQRIDWRLSSLEFYLKDTDINTFIRVGSTDLGEVGVWEYNSPGEYIYIDLENMNLDLVESTASLDFYYGLGNEVFVYREEGGLIGDYIYSEVFHKNRSYYTKRTHRVYNSHLSSIGRALPDSFPVNEDIGFGFWVTSEEDLNYGLAISSLDELVVATNKKIYIYLIQVGGGIFYRQRKAIYGSEGSKAVDSFNTTLSGRAEAAALMWVSNDGMFAFAGGRTLPEDLSKKTHKRYWLRKLSATNKESSVGFHNSIKDEYWVQIGNDIIIYEMGYDAFRVYQYDFTIKKKLKETDNELFLLATNNKVYKVDFSGDSRLAGEIETHYTSNAIAPMGQVVYLPEHEPKILQELFIAYSGTVSGAPEVTIKIDDNVEIPDKIRMNSGVSTDLTTTPIAIRYGKIKFNITFPATTAVFREFGNTFTFPGRGFSNNGAYIRGIGQLSGADAGVGL